MNFDPTNPTTTVGSSKVSLTSGWYVFGAVVFAIFTANTKIAPLVFGILGVGLIYQLNMMLQHK